MHFREITSESEFKELIDVYNRSACDYVTLDSETTGLSRFTDKLISISITSADSNEAFFVDRAYINPLQGLKKPLVLHNFKFDFHMLASAGIDCRNIRLYLDTLILDHLLEENNTHGLDDIIQRRYQDNYKELFWGKWKDMSGKLRDDWVDKKCPPYINTATYEINKDYLIEDELRNIQLFRDREEEEFKKEQMEYACKDVLYTDRVCRDTLIDLSAAGIPKSLIDHVHRLALALYDTESEGIHVDLPYVSKVGGELSQKISTLKSTIRETVDLDCQLVENDLYEKELDKRKTPKGKLGVKRPSFSFDSPLQLGNLLYDYLKLPVQLNKQRNRTVDDASLEHIQEKHPVIPLLREYRGHQKVFTSFIEGTLEKVHNGKIYPTLNPTGTVTGRLSHSNPNLAQLPSSGGVRGIYVPKKGYKFVSADYKQLEVTLAAHFSRDPALLSIVYEGASQHDITAAGLGISRSLAKTINFGMLYGAGPSKIASVLGCSLKDAERTYNKYWDTYPGVREFNRRCHDKIDKGEPIVTPFGRARHFPRTFANHWDKERAKRQAPNSLIQSTGADCTNWAFYTVNDQLMALGYGKALISVHDEIIIEVLDNRVDESRELLKTVMESVAKVINLTVPLTVDVSEGMLRWND